MDESFANLLHKIHLPQNESHKGQNGKLLIIGGSKLFHAASLWALTVASRIVVLVHYSSVPENNEIVAQEKREFRNGIVIPRGELDPYVQEDDCILIGPGMAREEETAQITNGLLKKYPNKQWVIDAGALQMMDISLIPHHAILTPHQGEFELLISKNDASQFLLPNNKKEMLIKFAKDHQCILLVKGHVDMVSDGNLFMEIEGGNAGMTKGGTGDVLAGLIASLVCTNDPWTATIIGSFINKKAGDMLYKNVGPFFNATDLANQIPKTMKEILSF